MKQINYISILLLLLVSTSVIGQVTISRQVIGSTGGYSIGSTMTLSSTVGEAVVQSLFSVNSILTQGFQQPEFSNDSVVEYEVINESCPGASNGSIYINNVLGCVGPYSVIIRSVDDTATILGQDTLGTGNYNVMIIGSTGCSYQTTIFVGIDSDEDCTLKFYTGITPNGDNKNDVWIIENIEQFPKNNVQIFNRWGQQVWDADGYDNSTIVWEGNENGGIEMPTGTYFYVAEVSGKIYKGWVELTR
jgi:gliding motility-associated-like protein